jgi:hypothetical protein
MLGRGWRSLSSGEWGSGQVYSDGGLSSGELGCPDVLSSVYSLALNCWTIIGIVARPIPTSDYRVLIGLTFSK